MTGETTMHTLADTIEPPNASRTAGLTVTDEIALEWILRVGAGLCFIGHGAFGIITKEGWLPFFALLGIGPDLAYTLMPVIGAVDILVGFLVIYRPRPIYLAYMVVWAVWTALLRPLIGMPVWEALERAGNYGVPLALMVMLGGGFGGLVAISRSGFKRFPRGVRVTPSTVRDVVTVLRWSTALLLLGHGALGLLSQKTLFATHYAVLGGDASWTPFIGGFEILLAAAVLAWNSAYLFGGIMIWKLATEALFPLSGAPVWEFVERGGSYAAPAALLVVSLSRGLRPGQMLGSSAALLAVLLLAWPGAAQVSETPTLGPAERPDPELVERALEGGYILACRHAITDRSRGDARNVDFDDPATQRVLSDEGVRQAREIGRHIRRLAFPAEPVLGGSYQRNVRTAELMFGADQTRDERLLAYGGYDRERAAPLFRGPPEPGTNRVLVTHQGILHRVFQDVQRGSIGEGDCLLVEPGEDGGTVLGLIEPEDWARAQRR